MIYTQEDVRKDYLKGISNLIGEKFVDRKMKDYIENFDLDFKLDPSDAYFLMTRGLIEQRSTKKLSDFLKDGLSEDIAIRISNRDGTISENVRKIYNPHWIEYHVSRVLVDVMGERPATICALKKPNLLSTLLTSIPYQGENLHSYLDKQLSKANLEFGSVVDLGRSVEAVNCCEAISDCSEKLQLPKKRLERGKILKKFGRKHEGKGNEQEI